MYSNIIAITPRGSGKVIAGPYWREHKKDDLGKPSGYYFRIALLSGAQLELIREDIIFSDRS